MSEVDESFVGRSTRFRTARFPGAVGGHVEAQTGNYAPAGSPVAEATRAQSLGQLQPITTELTDTAPPDQPPPPTLTQTAEDLGTSALGAGAQAAGTSFGSGAGASLATGGSLGEALSSGSEAVSNAVDRSLGAVKDFFAPSGSAPSALANVAPTVKPINTNPISLSPTTPNAASGTVGQGSGSLGSAGGSEVLGSSLGAGAGAGLVSFGIGLLTGESPGRAARQGAATGVGTAIGYAVGGPVGGFIGGAIGGIVGCFVRGTLVMMEDQTWKAVEAIEIEDRLMLGGRVIGTGKMLADDLWRYKETVVSGSHTVFEEGTWLRVRDSALAEKIDLDIPTIVYPVACENCLMVLEQFISADFAEIWNSQSMTDAQRIAALNDMAERNAVLKEWAGEWIVTVDMNDLPRKEHYQAEIRRCLNDARQSEAEEYEGLQPISTNPCQVVEVDLVTVPVGDRVPLCRVAPEQIRTLVARCRCGRTLSPSDAPYMGNR